MDVNLGENWNTASLRWDFCSSILSLFPLLVPVWSFHFLSSAFCYPTPVAATSDSDPGPILWVSAQGPQPQPQPPPMGHLAVRAGPSFFQPIPMYFQQWWPKRSKASTLCSALPLQQQLAPVFAAPMGQEAGWHRGAQSEGECECT